MSSKESKAKPKKKQMSKTEWKNYWAENKEQILSERRKKYQSDAGYRAIVAERNAKNYENTKTMKTKMPNEVSRKCKVMQEVGGQTSKMYDIEYVASRLNRSVPTIRKWEKDGTIPMTPYRVGTMKLYADQMVEAIVGGLEEQGFPVVIDSCALRDYVTARWQALNVI